MKKEVSEVREPRFEADKDDMQNFHGPLGELENKTSEVVADGLLLGDDPKRYSRSVLASAIILPKNTEAKILDEMGARLRRVPFTIEGIPPREEAELTRNIWEDISDDVRKDLLKGCAKVAQKRMGIDSSSVPDQTPYAMRLTHRHMHIVAKAASN